MTSHQDHRHDPAHTFAQLAVDLQAETSLTATAQTVLQFALETIDCDHADLVLTRGRGHLDVISATDTVTHLSHHVITRTGLNPCRAAIAGPVAVVVTDTTTEDHWPVWASEMAELGQRSALAVPIRIGPATLGALNLTAARPFAFEPSDHTTAHLLTQHAAVAVTHVRQTATLIQAVEARTAVGQAQGILMQRYSIGAEQAFAILRGCSQARNTKLQQIAAIVTTTGDLPN